MSIAFGTPFRSNAFFDLPVLGDLREQQSLFSATPSGAPYYSYLYARPASGPDNAIHLGLRNLGKVPATINMSYTVISTGADLHPSSGTVSYTSISDFPITIVPGGAVALEEKNIPTVGSGQVLVLRANVTGNTVRLQTSSTLAIDAY